MAVVARSLSFHSPLSEMPPSPPIADCDPWFTNIGNEDSGSPNGLAAPNENNSNIAEILDVQQSSFVNDGESVSQIFIDKKWPTQSEQQGKEEDPASWGGARPKNMSENMSKPIDDFPKDDGAHASKKQNRSRVKKTRGRKQKKWKPLHPDQLGFSVSRHSTISFDQDVSSDEHIFETNKDDCCASSSFATPLCRPISPIHDQADPTKTDDSKCQDTALSVNLNSHECQEDDITFFQNLGIDISDEANIDHFDDVLSWDGLKFQNRTKEQTLLKKKTSGSVAKESSRPQRCKSTTYSTLTATSSNLVAPCNNRPSLISKAMSTILKRYDTLKLFELECSSKSKIYIRRDRDRRVRKIHREVKSKNCAPVLYNPGKKKVYIHHRLYKMLGGEAHNFGSGRRGLPRMPAKDFDIRPMAVRPKAPPAERKSRPQNLRHAIDENTRPNHLEMDLASFLISLQHREMTPEDYEMLLRLDETVIPKTVSNGFLANLAIDTVAQDNGEGLECSVCMESYTVGQERKFLPCGHVFHSECIDNWLKNCSMNCPLDGLPVEIS